MVVRVKSVDKRNPQVRSQNRNKINQSISQCAGPFRRLAPSPIRTPFQIDDILHHDMNIEKQSGKDHSPAWINAWLQSKKGTECVVAR